MTAFVPVMSLNCKSILRDLALNCSWFGAFGLLLLWDVLVFSTVGSASDKMKIKQ